MLTPGYFLLNIEDWEKNQQYDQIILEGKQTLEQEILSLKDKASIFCSMAEASAHLGRYDDAEILSKNVLLMNILENCEEEYIKALVVESECLLAKNRPNESMVINDRAKELFGLYALNDRKLYAKVLYNEFLIYTEAHPNLELDTTLIEQLIDIYDDFKMAINKAQMLIRASHFLIENKPDQIQLAKFYLSLIDKQTLTQNKDLFLQHHHVNQRLHAVMSRTSQAPTATLFSQYGEWTLGAATMVAGVATVAYLMRPKL